MGYRQGTRVVPNANTHQRINWMQQGEKNCEFVLRIGNARLPAAVSLACGPLKLNTARKRCLAA